MNRLLLLTIASSVFVSAQSPAAEGRVAEITAPALSAERKSNYSGERAAGTAGNTTKPGAAAPADKGDVSTKSHARSSGKPFQKSVRSAMQAPSQRAQYFQIYDASSALLADRDGDDYFSEFRIRFDADTVLDDAWVYAKLYLRRYGEEDWVLYHVTDDFLIEEQDNDDDYFVTTTLDDGFATGEYDVAIDLYESDRDGVVASIDYVDSPNLGLLPLEEIGLDVPIEISGYSIRGVSTTLIVDDDGDGHYSRFRLTFDPDADFHGGLLYARVWVRAQGGDWIEEYVSNDFVVDEAGVADTYQVNVEWLNGYPTSYYDVQIDLYDAYTDLLAASAGSERVELAQIPLEDRTQDQRVSAPVIIDSGTATSSKEGGGGAFTLWWALTFAALLVGRRMRSRA